jgi:hypothetical protein
MYFSKAKLCDYTFYHLLMWFWHVHEMAELVSGIPAPHFGDESSWMRESAGSRFRRFLCLVLIDIRCFRIQPKISSRTPAWWPLSYTSGVSTNSLISCYGDRFTLLFIFNNNNNNNNLENREYGRRDPSRWPRDTLYPQKFALTSPTSGSRSIGIVLLRTQATEFL